MVYLKTRATLNIRAGEKQKKCSYDEQRNKAIMDNQMLNKITKLKISFQCLDFNSFIWI